MFGISMTGLDFTLGERNFVTIQISSFKNMIAAELKYQQAKLYSTILKLYLDVYEF